MYNALRYKEELERAGFTPTQAEVSARVLIDVMNENFATKSDLKELGLTLNSKLEQTAHVLDSKIDQTIQELRGSMQLLKGEIRESEYRMTIKMGAMMVITISTLGTLMKILQVH